jgi:uncharacterized BrkB/YihY/UPF0761 family membrane protein
LRGVLFGDCAHARGVLVASIIAFVFEIKSVVWACARPVYQPHGLDGLWHYDELSYLHLFLVLVLFFIALMYRLYTAAAEALPAALARCSIATAACILCAWLLPLLRILATEAQPMYGALGVLVRV